MLEFKKALVIAYFLIGDMYKLKRKYIILMKFEQNNCCSLF